MKDKTIEELMERREAIATEIDLPEADLDALMEEARAINEELERRKAEAEKRSNIRAAVAKKDGEKIVEKEKKMTIDEIRSSKEYVNAYANYIKTEDDRECRALLTELAPPAEGMSGPLPVPTIVDGFIRTAWEKNEILRRVRKTYVRGVLRVGFELSATGADAHQEGAAALQEEALEIGAVTITPRSIKKWITVSDEAMDMGGEDFLRYIIDEITYQIAKFIAHCIVVGISLMPGMPSNASVSVPTITNAGTDLLSIVAQAMALLNADASDIVVVMNRATWGQFKAAQAAANYAYDPFEGLPVVFDNEMPTIANSTETNPWLIVGDFARGALLNYPNGEEIRVKRDDLSLAEKDLVKFVGRAYVGIGIVADKMFAKVVKA